MKPSYREVATAALVVGGLGISLNLVPGIVPSWFAGNLYWVLALNLAIILCIALLQMPRFRANRPSRGQSFPKSFFVGRQQERADLERLLTENQVPVFNIYGIGGIGKTSLLREVIRGDRTFGTVIWQTAKKQLMEGDRIYNSTPFMTATFENLCREIAATFGQAVEYRQLVKDHQRKELVETLLAKHNTLLVVDNFETLDEDFDAFLKNLLGILTGTGSKAVLTCRHELEAIPSYKLEGLNLQATGELLNHELAPGAGARLPPETVAQVHAATNGLPLAIKLIAARVKRSHIAAIQSILDRLASIDFENANEVYEQFYTFIYQEIWNDLSRDAKLLLITLATFSLDEVATYDTLRQAFFDNRDNFSAADQDRFERAFSENRRAALLEAKETTGLYRFSLHPLTRAFVKTSLLKARPDDRPGPPMEPDHPAAL